MPNRLRSMNRRGQVILMVTFAMVPMLAMIGLVTDIGYMRYVQKSAQKAADAAVLAAISNYNATNAGSAFTCPGTTAPDWVCHNPAPYTCPGGLTSASNPVEDACLYAQENGFNPATNSRQSVTINSGANPSTTNPIPTASGVNNGAWWIT